MEKEPNKPAGALGRREGAELLKLPSRDPAQARRDTALRFGPLEGLAVVVGGGAGVWAETPVLDMTGGVFLSGAIGAAVGLGVLWFFKFAHRLWDQPMEKYAQLGDAYERVVVERDEALLDVRALQDTKPRIEVLPLDDDEPSVTPASLISRPPRAYAIRRIHVVNHGAETILRDWQVWLTMPGGDGLSPVDVMSTQEWSRMLHFMHGVDLPTVMCKSDVVRAERNVPLKLGIPFQVLGLDPEDVAALGMVVQVRFRDGDGGSWLYGEGALSRRETGQNDRL